MKIRRYREEDYPEKRELHLKVIREVNSEDYSEEQIEAWTTFDPGNDLEDHERMRWVAEEEDQIVGFSDYVPDEKRITGIYVHPDYLRQGIGSKLLQKIEEDAREKGLKKLRCTSSVTAKKFYQDHGFEVIEETTHDTNGEQLEAYRIQKGL